MYGDFQEHLRNAIEVIKKSVENRAGTEAGDYHLIGNIDGLLVLISGMDGMHAFQLDLMRMKDDLYKEVKRNV